MQEKRIDTEQLRREARPLARYRVSAGRRLLVGSRESGGVRIVDLPASGRGPAYEVGRGFRQAASLGAVVGDYLEQARRLDACPMSGEAVRAVAVDSDIALCTLLLEAR